MSCCYSLITKAPVSSQPAAATTPATIPTWLPDRAIALVAGRPDAWSWHQLKLQLDRIHQKAFFWMIYHNKFLQVIHGRPITDHPYLIQFRGKPVSKYGTAIVTFDQLSGVGDPLVIRTDRMFASGSCNMVIHEVAHTLDTYVFGLASAAATWRSIWQGVAWADIYSRQYADEAWAESYARIRMGLSVPAPVSNYFRAVFKAYGWET